jgi:hypothetical protein
MEGSEAGERVDRQAIGDIVRALILAPLVFLLILLAAWTVAVLLVALGPQPTGPDAVLPILQLDSVVVLATGTGVVVVAVWVAIHQWLAGSWHVVTTTVLTFLAMIPVAYLFLMVNGMGQR